MSDRPEPGVATAPPPPTVVEPPPPAPHPDRGRWIRRGLIAALLLGAVAVLVLGGRGADTDGVTTDRDPAIVRQFPMPGATALRQTEIGVELRPGYDGRLLINGVEVPEDQMEGAIDPNSVSPEELARYGIRPNNRNRVFFKPGPGKVITSLPNGEVTVSVRYFKDRQAEARGRTVTWSFQVD
ncbi:MAG: hypothetical protein KF703_04055 [Actinobacteria bacterium]|nr:hypothetical protein [Actinomycetota bacterium]